MTWYIVGAVLLLLVVLRFVGRQRHQWTVTDTGVSILHIQHEAYWFRCVVALDCLLNVFLGGMLGETLSSRIGRWWLVKRGGGTVWHWLASLLGHDLDHIDTDHVEGAIVGALARAQALVTVTTAALMAITAKSAKPPAMPPSLVR